MYNHVNKSGIRTVKIALAIITTVHQTMMRTMINTDGFPHSSRFNKYGIVSKSVQETGEKKGSVSVCKLLLHSHPEVSCLLLANPKIGSPTTIPHYPSSWSDMVCKHHPLRWLGYIPNSSEQASVHLETYYIHPCKGLTWTPIHLANEGKMWHWRATLLIYQAF